MRKLTDIDLAKLLDDEVFVELLEVSSGRHTDDKEFVLELVNEVLERHDTGIVVVDYDSLEQAVTTWTVA
jgi:hypothetical protein